jgi:hypothetical protein
MVSLNPDYAEHKWYDIAGQGLFTNHDPMQIVYMVLIFYTSRISLYRDSNNAV